MCTILRVLCAVAFLSVFIVIPTAVAQTDDVGFIQLRLNGTSTIPFFPAFLGESEDPFLDFNKLTELLEIDIRYDPALSGASGFLPDGGPRFNLNLERMELLIADRVISLDSDTVRVIDNKLYASWQALPQWLPVKIEWSLAAYEITVVTLFQLASEALKERRVQRRLLIQARADAKDIPIEDREVPWFDAGMFKLNLFASTGSDEPSQASATLNGVHRFLKGDLSYSITAPYNEEVETEAEVDFVRLTYYDPPKTWETVAGDTFVSFSPLVLNTAFFRGLSFFTGGRRLRYGGATLVGTAPVGSEVDLYRLGVLVDFTTADSQEFYRFQNIPLGQRSTLFEIRIFTPDGQKIVQFQQITAEEQMVPPQEWATQGGVGRSTSDQNPFEISGAEVRYGVIEPLTLGAYVINLNDFTILNDVDIETMESMAVFALVRPIGFLTLEFEQAQDSQSEGTANRFNAFAGFGAFSIIADFRNYDGDFAPPARTRSLRFSAPSLLQSANSYIGRTQLLLANVTLNTAIRDFGESRTETATGARIDRRLVGSLFGIFRFNQLRDSEPGYLTTGRDTSEMQLIYRVDRLTRAELTYQQITPVFGEAQSQTRAAYQKTATKISRWFYRAFYTQGSNFDDSGGGQLGYLFANNIRLSGQADSDGAWSIRVAYAVAIRASGDGIEAFEPEIFSRAGLEGVVFLDNNGDGIYQDGEEVLPDVTIKSPGIKNLASDSGGKFSGWGVPTDQPVDISIDLLTIDALFVPARDRFRMSARPGLLMRLDIPLEPAGGLDGEIGTESLAAESPFSGVEMVLQEVRGAEIITSLVEWDGSFIFEGIRPGNYVLFANPNDLKSVGYRLIPERLPVTFLSGDTPTWHSGLFFRSASISPRPPANAE